jgi:hypothetical protein
MSTGKKCVCKITKKKGNKGRIPSDFFLLLTFFVLLERKSMDFCGNICIIQGIIVPLQRSVE